MLFKTDGVAGFLGLISWGCFFVGLSTLLWGEQSQTSLRTVSLLAISQLVGIPLNESIGYIVFYCVIALFWAWLLYQIYGKKDSNLNKTYDKSLDNFPHWILCLCPAVAVSLLIYLLLNGGLGMSGCREYYTDNAKDCTEIFLKLLQFVIAVFAFIPQDYVIIKIWNDASEKGRVLMFKVKVFMALMFVCYVLWLVLWILRMRDINGSIPDDWKKQGLNIFKTDVFAMYFSACLVTPIVIAFPWIYRATCMRFCSCCRPKPKEASGDADLTLEPNTGTNNTGWEKEEKEEQQATKSWFSWSKEEDTNDAGEKKRSPFDDNDLEQANTTDISISKPYNSAPVNTNTSNYYGGSTAAPSSGDNNRPDWLQD